MGKGATRENDFENSLFDKIDRRREEERINKRYGRITPGREEEVVIVEKKKPEEYESGTFSPNAFFQLLSEAQAKHKKLKGEYSDERLNLIKLGKQSKERITLLRERNDKLLYSIDNINEIDKLNQIEKDMHYNDRDIATIKKELIDKGNEVEALRKDIVKLEEDIKKQDLKSYIEITKNVRLR